MNKKSAEGYRYPYIKGGKDMVAATLGACSCIRARGYFNKAVSYYSRKYRVDPEELKANIRARQAAGQKAKKPKEPRKYKWFIVCQTHYSDAWPTTKCDKPEIVRGLSRKSVEERFEKSDEEQTWHEGDGCFAKCYGHVIFGEYDTKEEAAENIKFWEDRIKIDNKLHRVMGEPELAGALCTEDVWEIMTGERIR